VARFDRYLLSQMMVLFGCFSRLILVSDLLINQAGDCLTAGREVSPAMSLCRVFPADLPNVIRLVLPVAGVRGRNSMSPTD